MFASQNMGDMGFGPKQLAACSCFGSVGHLRTLLAHLSWVVEPLGSHRISSVGSTGYFIATMACSVVKNKHHNQQGVLGELCPSPWNMKQSSACEAPKLIAVLGLDQFERSV